VASPLRWRRRRTGPALALAAALAVAGCASTAAGTAVTSANARAMSAPSITAAQAGQVFDHYVAATTEAFKTDDSPLALSVTTGAAQANLSAELKADRALTARDASGTPGGASAYRGSLTITPAVYTYGTPTFYRPEPSGYPRFFVAAVARAVKGVNPAAGIVTVVGGARVPVDGRVLMVFQQAAADGPWQLASTVQFPAGVTLPPLATDANGDVPQVPLTAANLLAQPFAVGPLQAAVVDDGPASAAAKSVAAGPLTTGLYQAARDRSDTGLQVPAGDIYQWAMEGTAYPAFALRTADGGALVLYSMYLNSTVAVPSYINKAEPQVPGPAIEIPLPLSLLLRPNQPAPHVELEEQDLFSFAAIDPPAPTAKLQVLATGGALNYASAT
jgi:hypothetical protein